MAELKFNCPQCGQQIEADESLRGQTVECPYCGKGIVVPRVKSPAPPGINARRSDALPEPNGAYASATKPKLRPIRQEETPNPLAGGQAESALPNQVNGDGLSVVQSRHQLPPADGDEQNAERNDSGMVANVVLALCLMVVLVIGGGMFVSSRCEKKYLALKNQIEAGGTSGREVSELSNRMREMSDRVGELKVAQASLSREIEAVSRKVADMETEHRRYGEDAVSRNRTLEEKCTSLAEQIEALSRQMAENSGAIRQLERRGRNTPLSAQPQVVEQNEPAKSDDSLKESLDDLQQKLNDLQEKLKRNLAELKELVKKNPACYINPKATSIINRENKIATMKDRRYCACVNVTFVRDSFYCSGCKRITSYRGDRDDDYDNGYCKVCRQMSFNRWLEARKKVDETAIINARIDELYAENESLEKQIRAMKNSRRKR